jgi:two-component system response regulator FlrC
MRRKKVLLVDKDGSDQAKIRKFLLEAGLRVSTAGDGLSAFEEIVGDHYDLVISELDLPQLKGLDLLKRIKEVKSSLPVILISANANVGDAVTAMKLGAYDFLSKPLTYKMLGLITSHLNHSENGAGKGRQEERFTIITKNSEMNRLLKEAGEIANSQASIFIQGESGTGKELFARYIHRKSGRKDRPFVAINCAALPETLLESELFGHEKGAFTGALTRKKGKFEIANHGTILLDEISEMDFHLQSKLLRVLQEREIDRVGGVGPITVDVRVIATTNRDIEIQMEEGKFREDLYYRLNVIPIHLPPLRERRDDISLLANYFIEKYNKLDGRAVKGLTKEAEDALSQMPWKGNVRELENVLERAILMCKGDHIEEEGLLMKGKAKKQDDPGHLFMPTVPLKEMEKKAIFQALDHTNGNRTHAAEILGISVRTLRNKMNDYRKTMESL